ncbi:hypothetical protein [Nocardia colli]|uniref:hypothetical protein n=1 Tax=Nocardia colli TaxID=2545717 RepID=UPI0035D95E47
MSDGYSQDRDQVPNHERGRIFENGTDRFFRDRENGYTQGSRKYEFRDNNGRVERIQFDKIRNEQDRSRTDSIEEKSGRIEGRKDEKQLRGIRELLDKGEINRHTLRSVEGESISKECQELINGLRRDFPDRFTHLQISRADARAIWAIGRDLERSKQLEAQAQGKQLELQGVGEKAREERAKELQNRRDKIAALAKAREVAEKLRKIVLFRECAARGRAEAPAVVRHERAQASEVAKAREQEAREKPSRDLADKKAALAQALEDQARRINQAHDKGQRVEVDRVRQAHADLSKALKEIREAEREQAFAMLTASGYTQHQAYKMQAVLEEERERQRREVVLGINTIGAIVAREDKAREAEAAPAKETGREPTEAEREQAAREKAERERVAELQRVNRASQGRPPQAAVLEPPQHAPEVQGHGRDSKENSRGPERTR